MPEEGTGFPITTRMAMEPTHILMFAGIILISPTVSHAQVAGTTVLGVSVAEMRQVALGWSVKHTILGQHVYNDKNEAVRNGR